MMVLVEENEVRECTRRGWLPKPFDEVWGKLMLSALELKRNQFEKCYDYHNEALACFIKDFKGREEPEDVVWTIEAMKRMTRDSRLCAEKADKHSRKSREESDETRNVRCAINASLPMFVISVSTREKSWRS